MSLHLFVYKGAYYLRKNKINKLLINVKNIECRKERSRTTRIEKNLFIRDSIIYYKISQLIDIRRRVTYKFM